ncbi:hypothetical protein [Phenylobacterium sp.]|uniref:hypothetical protein n=1 Tax=Phenylobacterium sp. TaxID=1871053 RepID=UPI0025F3D228|nr:hypothetical protein [Phenylobacterium sp.]
MTRLNHYLRPALAGGAAALLLGLAACEKKPETPAPVAATPAAAPATDAAAPPPASGESENEHHGDANQTLEEARAQGHREGMEMERDAHERGMDMGARAHADGMSAKGADAMPAKKADPPMKMDGHM